MPRRYDPQPELAAALRALREKRGLTLTELADRADVDKSWLSRIESGSVNPTWGSVRRLCAALDIGLIELVRRIETINRKPNARPS